MYEKCDLKFKAKHVPYLAPCATLFISRGIKIRAEFLPEEFFSLCSLLGMPIRREHILELKTLSVKDLIWSCASYCEKAESMCV